MCFPFALIGGVANLGFLLQTCVCTYIVCNTQVMHLHTLESRANASLECCAQYHADETKKKKKK
jgi:hypothetical protein